MKNVFPFTLLVLLALLAIGCCADGGGVDPDPPEPPEPPEPPTIQQRYLTLWGTAGDNGITITETPYQGVADTINYTSVTREQVAGFYPDLSNEVLFPLDAEYFYATNSDLDQTLYITKWADGTLSYSLVPFGSHDNYDKVTADNPIDIGTTEQLTNFSTDEDDEDNFVQQMYHVSPDLNRADYEDTPTGDAGEFKPLSITNNASGQYL
ncbi:MAG: hypothetical protein LBT09_06840 [Planctomycetaceae bacterium]|jgi:hypothetical protein|nr:hypothetical protein [Planctomycetaceae bacterium]